MLNLKILQHNINIMYCALIVFRSNNTACTIIPVYYNVSNNGVGMISVITVINFSSISCSGYCYCRYHVDLSLSNDSAVMFPIPITE